MIDEDVLYDYRLACFERLKALCKLEYLDPVAHAEFEARAHVGCAEGTVEEITAAIRRFTGEVLAAIRKSSN
jgi:hypothetical protein